jgi:uncharacterized protein (TIGR03086 family)
VCTEFDVTQLADHLIGSVTYLGAAAGAAAEMPAGAALGILSIEFLVHAWDFARATGQPVAVSDEVAQHVLGVARQIITPEARGGGSFADPVTPDPDAGLLDRLIAFTGRTTT